MTSPYALLEAERNLDRKRPEAKKAFLRRLRRVRLVPDVSEADLPGLPPGDAALYAAAQRAGADVFLTGDRRPFGRRMEDQDVRPRVRTPRAFLLEEGR